MKLSKTTGFGVVLLLLTSSLLAVDVPLNNWTVPPYRAQAASGELTTMNDISFAHPFVAIQPCRVADTRGNGAPIQGGIFANSAQRTWDLTGICGIPDGTAAISVNFTVVSAPGIPAGSFLLSWPTGQAPPPTAIITYGPNQVLSNAAIVPLGPGEQMEVNVSGSTHVIMDVNGYFAPISFESGVPFQWETTNSGTFGAGIFVNLYTGTSDSWGVVGRASSTGAGTAGVLGTSFNDTATETWGVWGNNETNGADSAGVYGTANLDDDPVPDFPILLYGVAGVRGVSGSNGVIGIGESSGVIGALEDEAGGLPIAQGRLGTSFGTDPGGGAAPWAVFALGDTGASGTKFFVEPHPSDASMIIKYATLEGPEVGTYFRGRGKFDRGMATIDIPETFRMVTAAEGLSIQVTPIGEMATVAVLQIGLDKIVVKGSRNVEFFYTVNGIRRGHEDMQVLAKDFMFVPEAPDAPMPAWLSSHQRQSLISNGTYTPEGKVNPETARRLGWDRVWEARGQPQRRPEPPTP